MKNRKRILAGLLAVIMTISMLPASAFAAEPGGAAAENDADPAIVSNEEYEVEPTVEDISDQGTQEEAGAPSEEAGDKEAAEPEADPAAEPETQPEAESGAGSETQQEAEPVSGPEEEQPAKTENEAPEAEETAETTEEDAEPVILNYEGRDYMVTATFDPTVFPAGVQMKAREIRKSNSGYQDLYDQALETVQKETEEEVEITHARFFDITFYTEEEDNIEPDGTVNVNIKYTKALTVESTDDISVLHFDEKKEEPQLMEIETAGSTDARVDEISFDTESFSVYAVIATTETGDNARLTVNFYGKNTAEGAAPIATMYVRAAETESDTAMATAVYNPEGNLDLTGGYVFNGKWTLDTPDNLEEKTIKEVREYIQSLDFSEGGVLNVYAVLNLKYTVQYLGRDGSTVGSHSVLVEKGETSASYTVNMDYSDDDNHKFEGWFVSKGADKITYGNDAAPEDGLHVNGTEITISGDVDFSVSAPEGHYLVFDENGKHATFNAARFVKSGEEADFTGMREMVRKGYTFDGWYTEAPSEYGGEPGGQQIIDKDGNQLVSPFYLSDTTTLYAKWLLPDTAPYTVIIWKQHTYDNGYDVGEIIHFDGTNGHEQGIPLTEIDTVVLNGQENSHLGYVSVDGIDKKDNPDIFGYGDETVDPYEGFFLYSYDKNVVIQPTGVTVLNVYYNRMVYTLEFNWDKKGTITARYGTNIGSYFPLAFDYVFGITEEAERYLISWDVDKDNTPNGNSLTYPDGKRIRYIDKMPAENIVFKGDILGGLNQIDCYYYVQSLDENGVSYGNDGYKFVKRLSGDGFIRKRANIIYYDQDFVQMQGFTRYACDEALPLQEGASLQFANNRPIIGIKTYLVEDVNFYYTRNKYTIKYYDGTYVDGNDNVQEEENLGLLKETDPIFFEADLSTYNKGAGNWYDASDKAHSGYVLDGWYLDKKCTTPCTFDKMPLNGMHVYAKWRKIQYRVFLHPNAGTKATDPSLDWGGKQETSFRVSYMDHVSVPTPTRNGYRFLGWYLDPDLEEQVYIKNILLDETMVKDYHKTGSNIDYTELDEWGVVKDPINSDVDRYWITKKFDLWAKWSRVLHGSDTNGMYVIYDADDGDTSVTAPADRTAHADNTKVVAAPAPSNPPAGKEFKYWIVQRWNGSDFVETDDTVKPGETFTVNVEKAKIVITGSDPEVVVAEEDLVLEQYKDTKFTYTIQLKAYYEDKPETTTFIPWFVNYNKKEYFHIDTAETLETKSTLAFNKEVDIQEAPERKGYKFVGWASVTIGNTYESAKEWCRTEDNYEQNLNKNNVFLYYNEEDLKFYSSYNEENNVYSNEVSKIAADSTSYEAMFAVWERSQFMIYHSAEAKMEGPFDVPLNTKGDDVVSFNMVEHVKEGCLYGGYYDYDEDAPDKKGGFSDYGPGTAMYPAGDAVYYLKEVDENYLKPQLFLVFSDSTRVIQKMYGLINVDSADKKNPESEDAEDPGSEETENTKSDYQGCGLLVGTGSVEKDLGLSTGLTDVIHVKKEGVQGDFKTLGKVNFGAPFSNSSFKGEFYIGCIDLSSYVAQNAELEIKAYYLTWDGIRVTGKKSRKIRFADTDPVKYIDWQQTKTGLAPSGPEYTIVIEGDSETDGDGKGFQSSGMQFAKDRTLDVSVDPVVTKHNVPEDWEGKTQEVEPGDNTGRIEYPEKDNYLFTGWFEDEALTMPADFSNVQEDMEVYAGYIPRKDVTLSMARKTGKTGNVTFTATVTVKNINSFTEVGVFCGHNGTATEAALTKKTYVSTGTGKNYKFSGPAEVKGLVSTDSFTASVYWVTKDGTRVTEEPRTCTYKSGTVKVQY